MKILLLLWLRTQVPTAPTTNSSHVCSCSARIRAEGCLSYIPLWLWSPAVNAMALSSFNTYTMFLFFCLLFKKLGPGPHGYSLSFTTTSPQSQRCAGNGVGDVTPGAARLISETAQRVHTIGQKQKNDQHLRRVQALLSGRQAKGLTSGSLCTCPSALIFPFLTHPTSSVLPAHTPCLLSLPFLLLPWSMVLELHQNNSSPIPQVAGSYARAGC